MLFVIFDIKGIVHKQFVLAGQTVITLWGFMVTMWKCVKTSSQTLATKTLAVASWQRNIWQFLSSLGIFWPKTHDYHPPTHHLTWLSLLQLYCFPPFWHNWCDWGRILGSPEHPHITSLAGCIYKDGRRAGNGANVRKGTTSRVMVTSRPKISFWPDGSTSPRYYG
jgi:hypothetical protein